MNVKALQTLTLGILDKWEHYDWSVQGFGLLRLYIKNVGRLHVWDSRLRYPNVSMIHNHSWDLRSTVVSGEMRNSRFQEFPLHFGHCDPYHKHRLITGYNCQIVSAQDTVGLFCYSLKVCRAGDSYSQEASEIHLSNALDGTVTLMERQADVNGEADIYWPAGSEWGTAKPRPATADEVHLAVSQAIALIETGL